MRKFFAQLRPLERRLAVGVLVILILVLNFVFVWPYFSYWSKLQHRLEDSRQKLQLYQTTIAEAANYKMQVKNLENQGEPIAREDQAINFMRTIQSQSAESGVGIVNNSRQTTRTNEFFVELTQNINVIATDQQLVDFLYKLGSGASMIRVRDLELQPDQAHQHLNANIRLVASYQKTGTTNHLENRNRKIKITVKTTTLILLVFLTGFGLQAQTPSNLRPVPQRPSVPATNVVPSALPGVSAVPSAFPLPSVPAESVAPPPSSGSKDEMVPAGDINFQGVDLDQVLDVYARYVGRTLLRANLPQAKIILRTETPLTRGEVIQALQGVLALNGIALINVGDKFVKAVPAAQAGQEAAAFNKGTAAELPDVGQYITYIVQLKYVKPSEMTPILQPFAKLQNSILSIDSNGILVLRDNAENVKRMLEMIKQVDVSVPEEFISEVIPIKYALADDIANALNSLGGSGGGTVSHRQLNCHDTHQWHQHADWRHNDRDTGSIPAKSAANDGHAGNRYVGNRHVRRRRHFQPAAECHHQPGGVGNDRTNPDFWPDKNHCRRAKQLTARLCHATGHANNQGNCLETGCVAFTGAHRSGHH